MKRIFTMLLFLPVSCLADWFGPNTYEDCILEAMKGTSSNVAAQEIKKACRAKFPFPAPPQPTVSKLSGNEANQALNNATLKKILPMFATTSSDHYVEFHNPLNQYVTHLTIAVKIDDAPAILYKGSAVSKPLSAGTANFSIGLSEKSKITSWWIHEIEISDTNPHNY